MIKYITALVAVFFTTAALSAEVIPYGSFNYKWSHDENASGVAYDKLEDNGSKIGVDIIDVGIEGQTITGFALLEVGVDTDDSASNTFDSRLAYVGASTEIGDISVGRQSHPYTDNVAENASIFEVYGGNSSFSYGSRSSNSLVYSNKVGPLSILNFKAMIDRAKDIFKELKSETLPEEEVKMMSGGQRQAVAIGRTKLSKAKVVLLDEPTAAISVRQVAEVLDLIKQLKAQGIAVLIISHRMPDVFAVSDRIAVLRRGKLVANKNANESSPEEVTALITGAIEKA